MGGRRPVVLSPYDAELYGHWWFEGPHFLESRTYRFRAHSMFDPELYRDKAEVAEWRKRDPIAIFSRWLLEAGLAHESEVRKIEDAAR